MGTRAFIGFRSDNGEVVATTVQLDGGYKWLGAEALKTYIDTDLEEMRFFFEQMRWVNPLPDSKDYTEEANEFYAKYNRKGKVILDILKTKDVEKAKALRENNVSDIGFGGFLSQVNGDYSFSNIEKDEEGKWTATFVKSPDIAKDHFLYGYLYDLKNDTFEVYSSKLKDVKTEKPVYEEAESRFRLVQTFSITRDMNIRKLLKIFDHIDQVIDWYEEKYSKEDYECIWEENILSDMDFILENIIKEVNQERKVYRIPLPRMEE
jgi:hypothetical protein